MNALFHRVARLGVLIPALALFAACDNPVDPHDHHEEAVGVVITDMGGTTLAQTQLQGNIAVWVGSPVLRVPVGDELAVRIWFVARDGDRFQLPFAGAEYTTRVTVANTAVARFEPHGDHGDFKGIAVGSTTASIAVWHGSHADWQIDGLPIQVYQP